MSANPMALAGPPKLSRALPKALPHNAVEALFETVVRDEESPRRTDWAERDLAISLTGLLAGLCADELRQADIGDIRTAGDAVAVVQVHSNGGKEHVVPIEAELLSLIEVYLESRAIRFPNTTTRNMDHSAAEHRATTYQSRADGVRLAQCAPCGTCYLHRSIDGHSSAHRLARILRVGSNCGALAAAVLAAVGGMRWCALGCIWCRHSQRSPAI